MQKTLAANAGHTIILRVKSERVSTPCLANELDMASGRLRSRRCYQRGYALSHHAVAFPNPLLLPFSTLIGPHGCSRCQGVRADSCEIADSARRFPPRFSPLTHKRSISCHIQRNGSRWQNDDMEREGRGGDEWRTVRMDISPTVCMLTGHRRRGEGDRYFVTFYERGILASQDITVERLRRANADVDCTLLWCLAERRLRAHDRVQDSGTEEAPRSDDHDDSCSDSAGPPPRSREQSKEPGKSAPVSGQAAQPASPAKPQPLQGSGQHDDGDLAEPAQRTGRTSLRPPTRSQVRSPYFAIARRAAGKRGGKHDGKSDGHQAPKGGRDRKSHVDHNAPAESLLKQLIGMTTPAFLREIPDGNERERVHRFLVELRVRAAAGTLCFGGWHCPGPVTQTTLRAVRAAAYERAGAAAADLAEVEWTAANSGIGRLDRDSEPTQPSSMPTCEGTDVEGRLPAEGASHNDNAVVDETGRREPGSPPRSSRQSSPSLPLRRPGCDSGREDDDAVNDE